MENNIDNPMFTYVIDSETRVDFNKDYLMIIQNGKGLKDMVHIHRDDLEKYRAALMHVGLYYDGKLIDNNLAIEK